MDQIPSIYIQIAESLLMINIYGQGEQSMLIVINGQCQGSSVPVNGYRLKVYFKVYGYCRWKMTIALFYGQCR